MIKNTSGKYFEEAYLILKDDYGEDEPLDDIVSEANRIVERSISKKPRRLSKFSSLLLFCLGMSLSAFLYTLILLILN